jgi:Major tropism determinant N-terminal domain/Collagen triple helix repeat (20 copies)
MTSRLQNRRDTAASWTSANPTLAAGEMGLETDTAKWKMGNGSTAWNSLAYAYSAGAQGTTGTQGATGSQGIQGIQGTTGAQGTVGQQGITGTQGLTGAQGIQGTTGNAGGGISGFNAQTGTTYTLVAGDVNKLVTASNTGGITITIPISTFSANDVINVQQINSGQVTFAAASGGTITSTGATSTAPKLRAQYSACSIICTVGGATPSFTVVGDIS